MIALALVLGGLTVTDLASAAATATALAGRFPAVVVTAGGDGGLAGAGIAGLTVLLLALLTNIFERQQEARQPFVRVVDVTEQTMDPRPWGQNWPHQYDSYLKTALPTTTKYGGRGPGASAPSPASSTTTA